MIFSMLPNSPRVKKDAIIAFPECSIRFGTSCLCRIKVPAQVG